MGKRTTKSLAARIQVDYLKKRIPFRYWKRILLVGFLVTGLLWISWAIFFGKKQSYAPGPVSEAHRLFQNNCGECHTQAGKQVSNDACLKCHADLVHHKDEQRNLPRCVDCHIEHRRSHLREAVTSANCASCHVDLKRKDDKKSEFASGICRLDQGHPEFRFFEEMKTDATAMKLNHKVHMKPDLEGPEGKKVTLKCSDCHNVDMKKDPQGVYRNAALTYEKNCKDCHLLGFDVQFSESVAPHKKPEEVRTYLESFYQEKIKEDPLLYKKEPERALAGPLKKQETFPSGEAWVQEKARLAEKKLLKDTCLECHAWKYNEGRLPEVPKVVMQEKYLKKGRFDHAAHRAMACASCHVKVLQSEKTSDFLVPGVETCTKCHNRRGLARDTCYECHRYHSPGSEKNMEGNVWP